MLIKFFGSFKKKNNICIQYAVQCTYIIHILHFERLDPNPHYKGHLSATQVHVRSSPFSLFSTLFYIFFCQSACTTDLFLCICLCLSPSLYFAAFSYIFFCLNFSVSLYAVSHVHQSHIVVVPIKRWAASWHGGLWRAALLPVVPKTVGSGRVSCHGYY